LTVYSLFVVPKNNVRFIGLRVDGLLYELLGTKPVILHFHLP